MKQECVWRQEKTERFPNPTSKFSKFYYDENITTEKLIEDVLTEDFFGFLNITMSAPEQVRKKFDALDFPPLFKKYQPKKQDLSENMQQFFKSNLRNQLTVGYNAEKMTLSSELVKFYLREGYVIDEIHWALEYQRGLEVI